MILWFLLLFVLRSFRTSNLSLSAIVNARSSTYVGYLSSILRIHDLELRIYKVRLKYVRYKDCEYTRISGG